MRHLNSACTGAVRAAFLKEKFPFPFVSRPDTLCQWCSPIGVSPALNVDACSALLQPAPDLAFSQLIDHHPFQLRRPDPVTAFSRSSTEMKLRRFFAAEDVEAGVGGVAGGAGTSTSAWNRSSAAPVRTP